MITASDLFGQIDPVGFATHRLGFTPDPKQALVLSSPATGGILNCTATSASPAFTGVLCGRFWHSGAGRVIAWHAIAIDTGDPRHYPQANALKEEL
jgi:hypothetical protein